MESFHIREKFDDRIKKYFKSYYMRTESIMATESGAYQTASRRLKFRPMKNLTVSSMKIRFRGGLKLVVTYKHIRYHKYDEKHH